MEVKQEPEDPFIEEYKIDIEEYSTPSEIITECWDSEKRNIKLCSTMKSEFISIKQENKTDLLIDNLQETSIEVESEIEQIIDEADIKGNSIQSSDIKQSRKDADVKDDIEIVDHELKEELDKIREYVNPFKNIHDLKVCSNEIAISERMCYCSKTDNNPVKCEICSKDPQQRQSVKNRICRINGKLSESECYCNKHLRTDTGEKHDICCSYFTQQSQLNKSLDTHNREKPFKCDVCSKSFSKKNHLNVHLRIHTGERPFKCNICTKCFSHKNSLNTHLRIHTGEKPFECNICAKSFSRKAHLNEHLLIHTGDKPFECNVCAKCFSSKKNLNEHLRIHTGEKPLKCNVCAKSFSSKKNLNEHLHIHTGEKPLKCNICTKSFAQKSVLNVHLRIHTGEKPFKCSTCTKSFSQKSYLVRHLRIHTGEKPS